VVDQIRTAMSAAEAATRRGTDEITAQVKAAMEAQVMATREGAEACVEAIRAGMNREVQAVREGTEKEVAERRKGAEKSRGILSSMADFGKQMLLWNVGFSIFNRATEAVTGFASGLVTV